jgi:hypothetical protein
MRRAVHEEEGFGADCLWSYVDARDVGRACQLWLELPRASRSFKSVDRHLSALNNSYDRVIFECIQWRWAHNGRLGRG